MSVAYQKPMVRSELRFLNALEKCHAVLDCRIAVQRKVFDSAGMRKDSGIADLYHRYGWMHTDFALMDKRTGKTVLAIELDGDSHNDARQKQNDLLKDAFLNSAGIPVVRFQVQRFYDFKRMNGVILAGRHEGVKRASGEIRNPTTADIRKIVEDDLNIGEKIPGLSPEEFRFRNTRGWR